MKKWNGLEVFECAECGFSTVDAEMLSDHAKKTGHAVDPAQETDPAESGADEIKSEEKKAEKVKHAKGEE